MKTISKWTALLLTVLLLVGTLPIGVFSAEENEELTHELTSLSFSLSDGEETQPLRLEQENGAYVLYVPDYIYENFSGDVGYVQAETANPNDKVWITNKFLGRIYMFTTVSEGEWCKLSSNWYQIISGNFLQVSMGPEAPEKKSGTAPAAAEKTYDIAIRMIPTLKSLEFPDFTSVDQEFSSDVIEYTVYVPANQASLSISAEGYNSNNTGCNILYNGGDSSEIPLAWDENGQMTVTVNVSNSAAQTDYTLHLIRGETNDVPTFAFPPKSAEYVDTDTAAALNVWASASGAVSYQWYENTINSNEGGVAIDGAVSASYIPVITNVGTNTQTKYYYCVASNTADDAVYTAASGVAAVIVQPDPMPYNVQLIQADGSALPDGGYSYNSGDEGVVLTVSAENNNENAQWTYKWMYGYLEDDGSFRPSPQNVGSGVYDQREYQIPTIRAERPLYYMCFVTCEAAGVTRTAESPKVLVKIMAHDAMTPVIAQQPQSSVYIKGVTSVNPLTVKADFPDDGGDITYYWESSEDGVHFTDTGESGYSGTYELPVPADKTYYRCHLVNTLVNLAGETYTAEIYSDVVYIDFKSSEWNGEGTADSPYLLESKEDLLLLQETVNVDGATLEGVYFRMTGNLTLPQDWVPLGTAVKKVFSGHIDGDGYTLTVPAGGLPLLGYVGKASVCNLAIYGEQIAGYGLVNNYAVNSAYPETITIQNVTLKSGTQTLKSGLIGGYASGSNVVRISGCTIEPGVIIGYDRQQSNIGAFAGEFNGYIDGCVNHGTVYGVNFVGGIVANKGQTMGSFVVRNCQFDGIVEATGNYAGGIAGGGYGGTIWGIASAPNTPCATIQNCISSGSITGGNYVGGILGAEPGVKQCWANGIGYIQNNLFTGTLHTLEQNAYVGGIIGYMCSVDRYNIITNNFYIDSSTSLGIGAIPLVDTTCGTVDTSDGSVTYVTTEKYARYDDPLGADADQLSKAVSSAALTDGSVTELLNEGANSFKNWTQGAAYPTHLDAPVAYRITITGSYKDTYYMGEALDLSGAVFTADWSDGTVTNPSLSEITVTGYDADIRGIQTVTVLFGAAKAEIKVTVLKPAGSDITVTVSILGDALHSEGETAIHTMADNNLEVWVDNQQYEVGNNATVWDVIQKVLEDYEMTCSNPSGNYIESITRNGITLGAFDNGANSGWMYTLNGEYPLLGVSEQFLEEGADIVFHYTDDYGKEFVFAEDKKTAEEVISLIDAIGEVTLSSADSIAIARTAYDGLSDEQKQLVANYDVLVAAEEAFAKLFVDAEALENIYQTTGDYIVSLGIPGVGSIGGEWSIIGLARGGYAVPDGYYEAYYQNVLNYVKENINDKEQLHRSKSTENARLILALTAIGKDVTDVDGHNLLMGLTDMVYVQKQGINGPIWALIAFDSHNYEIPEDSDAADQVTREKLIGYILDAQLPNGGWTLSGTEADPDMTAMALQALAPYYDTNEEVHAAIDNALRCLSGLQTSIGGYISWGTANVESCAQVVVALTALGINPAEDERFIKNGCSVLDALSVFYADGGGFRHAVDGDVDGMATEQGYYALVSYFRYLGGETALYDMSDVTIGDPGQEDEENNQPDDSGKPQDPQAMQSGSNHSQTPQAAQSDNKDVQNPQTGDTANVVIYFGLMVFSLAGIAVTASHKRRGKQR